jgi:hypothetical protein
MLINNHVKGPTRVAEKLNETSLASLRSVRWGPGLSKPKAVIGDLQMICDSVPGWPLTPAQISPANPRTSKLGVYQCSALHLLVDPVDCSRPALLLFCCIGTQARSFGMSAIPKSSFLGDFARSWQLKSVNTPCHRGLPFASLPVFILEPRPSTPTCQSSQGLGSSVVASTPAWRCRWPPNPQVSARRSDLRPDPTPRLTDFGLLAFAHKALSEFVLARTSHTQATGGTFLHFRLDPFPLWPHLTRPLPPYTLAFC